MDVSTPVMLPHMMVNKKKNANEDTFSLGDAKETPNKDRVVGFEKI